MLVRQEHLVDESVIQQPVARIEIDLVEDLERALTNLLEVGAHLVRLEDRKLPADLPRLLDGVIEVTELAAQRLPATDPPDEPELLEVRDVPEIPDQRAEDRRVDAVELLVGERLDQPEGVTACLSQPLGE